MSQGIRTLYKVEIRTQFYSLENSDEKIEQQNICDQQIKCDDEPHNGVAMLVPSWRAKECCRVIN